MVQHTCVRCDKKFKFKGDYIRHQNRKFKCEIKTNDIFIKNNLFFNQNTTTFQENINKLYSSFNILQLDINRLNDKIIELENNNNKLLINLENINITTPDNNLLKNLYKYKSEFVYIIREREFVRINENTYKIGKTKQTDILSRFNGYPKGTEIICFFGVLDCNKYEREIIKNFTDLFIIRKDYGNEYFTGDINEMKTIFTNIINKF